MNANITRYESDNNEFFSENHHTSLSEDTMNPESHNTSDIKLNNSSTSGIPNFYNSLNFNSFYKNTPLPTTECLGNLIDPRELPSSSSCIAHNEPSISDFSIRGETTPPGGIIVPPAYDSDQDVTLSTSRDSDSPISTTSASLHINFTLLHVTPTQNICATSPYLSRFSSDFHRYSLQPFRSHRNFSPLLTPPPQTNNLISNLSHPDNQLDSPRYSNIPPLVYNHVAHMMCLHTLGAKPYYTVYSATLSLHHLQFLPPDDVVISLGSRFTRTEAAMYMSLYGFLPRHFQEPGDLNHPTDAPTIYTLLKHYLHHDKIPSDIPTPRPAVRHFTDTEAALYLSLTATLPPYYTYDDTSYTAPHPTTCGRATKEPHSSGTPPFHDTTPTCSTTLPEIICYPLDTSSLTTPFTPPPDTNTHS